MVPATEVNGAAEPTAQMLREWLDGVLPIDRIAAEALPDILDDLRRQLVPLAGRTLQQVLLDPATDAAALLTLKNFAKRLCARCPPPAPEHETALTIYFAAIASALIHHNRRITTHSYETLERSFEQLADKSWMPEQLMDLFRRACIRCRGMK